MRLLRFCTLAVPLAAGAIASVAADDMAKYPTRPIRIVVPFSAGSVVDLRARQIGDRLAKNMGQPVIVDNRPDATNIIGANPVAKASPDG
jgi:tripartite-type tricarboxylate transporter receptor subunit TctC